MPEFDNIQEILQKLERKEDRFPRAAVCAAISRRDEIVPELLRILEQTAANLEAMSSDHSYFAPIYAMFLLAQFREPRAFPILIRLFSTPGEAVMDLAGDVVTENLGDILASVAFGDMKELAALAENPQVNEYVRSAALKAMVASVAFGELTRDEVMAYFASLFRGRLAREPDYIWTSLVSRCVDLYPGEVYEDIRQAYDDCLVENFVIRWEDIEEVYALGQQAAIARLAEFHRFIDTVEEMSGWACFKQEGKKRPAGHATRPRSVPKVGRNEPCPCGSGKKFKKCCGA